MPKSVSIQVDHVLFFLVFLIQDISSSKAKGNDCFSQDLSLKKPSVISKKKRVIKRTIPKKSPLGFRGRITEFYKKHKILTGVILTTAAIAIVGGGYFFYHYLSKRKFPKICKDGMKIRKFKKKDTEDLRYFFQTPAITYTFMASRNSLSDRSFSDMIKEYDSSFPFCSYTVRIVSNGQKKIIGILGIELPPYVNEECPIFYAVRPEFQRQGWGTKMIRSLQEELIPHLKRYGYLKECRSLIAYIFNDNVSSIGLAKKCGFSEVTMNKKKEKSEDSLKFSYKLG